MTTLLQLQQREAFERNVTLALGAGACGGVVHLILGRLGVPVPLAWLTLVACSAAMARGDRIDRALLIGGALVAGGAPFLMGLSAAWSIALGGAVGGYLMVRAHLCDRGEEGQVAAARPGTLNHVLGSLATAGLALLGARVTSVLELRLADIDTPPAVASLVLGTIFALFVALGSLPAHLALRPDPVEARCEALIPMLSGELRVLASRALDVYRRCGDALVPLPRSRERDALARTLSDLTRGAVELASEWSGVEDQLEARSRVQLASEISELRTAFNASSDAVARRQLQLAIDSLDEEHVRLDELSVRRERIVAKLKAQVALLERARIALVSLRSGQAQIRSAEVSALARRLATLAQVQGDEAKLADEVATGAELAQAEAMTTLQSVREKVRA